MAGHRQMVSIAGRRGAATVEGMKVTSGFRVDLIAAEPPGTPRIPTEALLAAAEKDPSSLPALPPADRWTIGTALAIHGKDAKDRFLPKLTWSGIEDSVGTPMNRHQKPFADDYVEPLAGIVRATGSPAHERELEKLIRPSQRGRRR